MSTSTSARSSTRHVTVEKNAVVGSWNVAASSAGRSRRSALAVSGEWNPPDTFRRRARRAPAACAASIRAATPASVPETTSWPGQL